MSDPILDAMSTGDVYQSRILIHQMIKDACVCKDTLMQINTSLEVQLEALDTFINTRVHLSMMLRSPSMCSRATHEHMSVIRKDIAGWLFLFDSSVTQCAAIARLFRAVLANSSDKVALSSWKTATVRYLDLLYQCNKLYYNILERVALEEPNEDTQGFTESLVDESVRMTCFTSFLQSFSSSLQVPSAVQFQSQVKIRKPSAGDIGVARDAAMWCLVNIPLGLLVFYPSWFPLISETYSEETRKYPTDAECATTFSLLLYSASAAPDANQIKLQTPAHSFVIELQSAHQRDAWMQVLSEAISMSLSSVNLSSSAAGQTERNFSSQLAQQLYAIPGNDKCADCQEASPTWCSISLGIMICHKCSGVHRSLSSSVSKVRSTTLDKLDDTMPLMMKLGNYRVNAVYMANAPPVKHCLGPGSSQAERTEWIGRKYVQLQFISPLAEYQVDSLLNVDTDDDTSVIALIHVVSQLENEQLESLLRRAVKARQSFLASYISLRCLTIPPDTIGDALQMEMWEFVKLLIYAGSQLTEYHLEQLDDQHRAMFEKPMVYIGDSSSEDGDNDEEKRSTPDNSAAAVKPIMTGVHPINISGPTKKSPRILSVSHGAGGGMISPVGARSASPNTNRRSLQGLLKGRQSADKSSPKMGGAKPRIQKVRKKKGTFGKK